MDATYINNQINNVDNQLTSLIAARANIEKAQNSCQTALSEWKSSYRNLTSNSEILKVKKKDAFEGEMANSLGKRVRSLSKDIKSGISEADKLDTALTEQLNAINTKIAQLIKDRNSLVQQFNNLPTEP